MTQTTPDDTKRSTSRRSKDTDLFGGASSTSGISSDTDTSEAHSSGKLTVQKNKGGRPKGRPTYNQDIADRICEELRKGKTLRAVCRLPGMPDEALVRQWANDEALGFYSQYAQAREIGYHVMADELIDICDGTDDPDSKPDRDRLRVDTRKWLLSKALPKTYGDKIQNEHTGANGGPINISWSDPE